MVDALRNPVSALVPGGLVLDLQVVRPGPRIEAGGSLVSEVDGSPLFRRADAAAAAVDLLVAEGTLVEEAVDDHDVVKRYETGRALVDDWSDGERTLPAALAPALAADERPFLVRERCRLRRLRLSG